MAKVATIVLAVLLTVWITAVNTHAQGFSCGIVVNSLMRCRTYLKQGGTLPGACCDGVRALNRAANSPAARRTACNCMKSAAEAYGVNPYYAAALPKKCKVNVGYAINFHTDCNKVH